MLIADSLIRFLRRGELWQREKALWEKAERPGCCSICGRVYRCELHPLGVQMIGDVPVPTARFIVVACPEGHERYEWIE